jgi:transposase
MGRRLRREEVVTIEVLAERGVPGRAIARTLGVDEKTVRYRLARLREPRPDGRSKPFAAEALAEVIRVWMERHEGRGRNVAALYDHLVVEHDYRGSYKSVQRYVRAHYPRPRRRARRRVETPPGAQAQVDWAEHPGVWIAGRREPLCAFHLELGFSRHGAVIWCRSHDQLAWLSAHNEAFVRLGGVPAVLRIDNVKTAIVRGAGAWGEIHPAYRRYAQTLRFHVDACAPRAPQAKGKVERWIGDGRRFVDPRDRHWNDLEELQAWSDERVLARSRRRRCPATGTSAWEAYCEERPYLGPLPILPEPARSASTAWSPSRDAATRCRSATWDGASRCAAVPLACRSWPTPRWWPCTRAAPIGGS